MISCRMVTDLDDPELLVYHGLNEVQLKHYYEPHGGLFICESPKVIRRALKAGYETCGDCSEMETCEKVGMIISNNIDAFLKLKGKKEIL